VLEEASGLTGFAIRRRFGRGTVIGPLVARDEADRILLVASLAEPGFVRLDIPGDAHQLESWLVQRGLSPAGDVTTMVNGSWPTPPSYIRRFGLVSQALG
jgi:hypothetical protein